MHPGAGPTDPNGRCMSSPRRFCPPASNCLVDWAVHGTTGYNYLNDLNGLFVDAVAGAPYPSRIRQADRRDRTVRRRALRREAADHVHRDGERAERARAHARSHRREQPQVARLHARQPPRRHHRSRRLLPGVSNLRRRARLAAADRAVVSRAIARARRRNPAMESSIFDFFREVVLPRDPNDEAVPPGQERRDGYPPVDETEARERLRFAMKFQQYTGPVQAKGLEDTAFYRYNVLLSLNEVGGDPSRFGRVGRGIPRGQRRAPRDWPFEMLATATHDTKVGEDVRARINVLSEMPDEWGRQVSKWMRINRAHRSIVDGEPAPDRADEYRFYQALVGVWPADLPEDATQAPAELVERLCEYMLKAVREAKVHTSWLTTNEPYEDALVAVRPARAVRARQAPGCCSAFLPFQARIASLGMINSLAQVDVETRLARRAGLLPGHRAVGAEPRRSRQSPAGGLRRRGRGCSTTWMRCSRTDAGRARRRGRRSGCATGRRPHQAPRHGRWPAPAAGDAARVSAAGPICRSSTEITVPAGGGGVRKNRAMRQTGRLTPCIFAAPRLCQPSIDARVRRAARRRSAGRRRGSCCRAALADRTFRDALTGAEILRHGPAIPRGFFSARSFHDGAGRDSPSRLMPAAHRSVST